MHRYIGQFQFYQKSLGLIINYIAVSRWGLMNDLYIVSGEESGNSTFIFLITLTPLVAFLFFSFIRSKKLSFRIKLVLVMISFKDLYSWKAYDYLKRISDYTVHDNLKFHDIYQKSFQSPYH